MSRRFDDSQLHFPENWWMEPFFEDEWGVTWARIKGHSFYYVSEDGCVVSKNKNDIPRILSTWENIHGHKYVQIDGKKLLVHRLVAQAFIYNDKNYPIVRHMDDDPNNNTYHNLRWGTTKDNVDDMFRNGGDFHIPVYCYENNTVYRSCADAAKDLGVSRASITNCCKGKTANVLGFHLCYEDDKELFFKEKRYLRESKNNFKPIKAIYPNGDERIFKSRKEASEFLNIPNCGISSVVNGHIPHTHGFKFKEVNV